MVVIDSTMHGQQGQNTQNTYACRNAQKRPAKSGRHQKKFHPRSEHYFVFALLLTPTGLRIPYWLPFSTKEYCATFGRLHQTQADLAAQLIDTLALAAGTPVVVVGDTAFEAKPVRQACRRRDWHWVVPLNPERRLAGPQGKRPKVRSLYDELQAQDFRRVSCRLDQGEHAALARVSPKRSQSRKHQRTCRVHHRTATIHNIGEIAVLFPTKKAPSASGGVSVQKVLISNAPSAATEQLLAWFSLRWQVEPTIDEQKTHQTPWRVTKPAHLRSGTPLGVIQEMYALAVGNYVARALMAAAAAGAGLDSDRLSFVGCLQVLRTRPPEMPSGPSRQAGWYQAFLQELSRERAGPRRNRVNPRVVRVRMSKFKKKRPEHRGLPKIGSCFADRVIPRPAA